MSLIMLAKSKSSWLLSRDTKSRKSTFSSGFVSSFRATVCMSFALLTAAVGLILGILAWVGGSDDFVHRKNIKHLTFLFG